MFKNKVCEKQKLIGMYVQLSDISISKIAGLTGYDFIWVDTEHSYMSFETLLSHIISIKSTGTPVVVRVPQNDLTFTKKTLEMGVDGIIFPMIRSAKEANEAISWTLYPPYGTRGFGPMNAVDFGIKNGSEYLKNTKDEMARFIQIEHKDAIENLDEIMQNEYIDGYIFGPNDLAASYNLPGQPFCEEIKNIMTKAIEKLRKNNKFVGIASGGISPEVLEYWSSFNIDFLSAGADFDFIREGAKNNKENLEKIFKNK